MHSLLKTALVCPFLFLFAVICWGGALPHQESSTVPKPEKLRVLITDCIDKSSVPRDPEVVRAVTDALYVALDRFGTKSFDTITQQEVWATAERLGLPVPESTGPSGHWKQEDKIRLGKALNADLLCDGTVAIAVDRKNAKLCNFAISVWLRDITLQVPRTGGMWTEWKKPLRTAITLGVNDAVQQCPKRLLPAVHVLSRMGDMVDVDLGVRGGVKVGDDMVVWRKIADQKIKVGMVKVSRVHPQDSEGTIVSETGGIQAGDAIFVYCQPFAGPL
jgi:hypothetical protein